MSNIFAIRKDISAYQVLDLDLLDVTRGIPDNVDIDSIYDFSQGNTKMASWWQAPETRFINANGKKAAAIPDISCWVDAALVLSPRAYRFLNDSLAAYGEFLPVIVGGEKYYIFNCFTLGKVNENACVFNREEGMQAGLKYLEFDPSVSSLLVFKAAIEGCLTLFCNQNFKDIVESFELRGVVFDTELIIA